MAVVLQSSPSRCIESKQSISVADVAFAAFEQKCWSPGLQAERQSEANPLIQDGRDCWGGLVPHFLHRLGCYDEFATYARRRQAHPQRAKERRDDDSTRAASAASASEDEQLLDDASMSQALIIAMGDTLVDSLQRCVDSFWREVHTSQHRQPSTSTPQGTTAQQPQPHPVELFRSKVAALRRVRQACSCLNAEVEFHILTNSVQKQKSGKRQGSNGMGLPGDGRANSFWRLFHRDENGRRLSRPSLEAAPGVAGVSKSTRKVARSTSLTGISPPRPALAAPAIDAVLDGGNVVDIGSCAANLSDVPHPAAKARKASKSKLFTGVEYQSEFGVLRLLGAGSQGTSTSRKLIRPWQEVQTLRAEQSAKQVPRKMPTTSCFQEPDDFANAKHFDAGGVLEPSSSQLQARRQRDKKPIPDGNDVQPPPPRMVPPPALPPVGDQVSPRATRTNSEPMLRHSPTSRARGIAARLKTIGSQGALQPLPNILASTPLPPIVGMGAPVGNPFETPRTEASSRAMAGEGSDAASPGFPSSPDEDADEAALRYITVCKAAGVVPTPIALAFARARSIGGHNEVLVDDDLKALAVMVRHLDSLASVDLSGNDTLSDGALKLLMQKLYGRPAMQTCKRLILNGCKLAARTAIDACIGLLNEPDGLLNLHHLDLSGIELPVGSMLPLCRAVQSHPALKSVSLANTGMGPQMNSEQCVVSLLGSPRLEELDLGWNCFSADVFDALGNAVCEHKNLRTLRLANCTSRQTDSTGEGSIMRFLGCLAADTTLTVLDVSMNRIGEQGALVLEDSLDRHRKLTELNISHNPLGVSGMRSFLRLLSRESSGLLRFDCSQCQNLLDTERQQGFNAADPSGVYALDLSNPYCRAMLRMLYKSCERFGIAPEQAFSDVEYVQPGGPPVATKQQAPTGKSGASAEPKKAAGSSGSQQNPTKGSRRTVSKSKAKEADPVSYKHPQKRDDKGVWQVPMSGNLNLTFSISDAVAKLQQEQTYEMLPGCASARSRTEPCRPAPQNIEYLKCYYALVRFRPSFRKVAPLLAQFRSFAQQHQEQSLLLDALSRDFILEVQHIDQLLHVRSRSVDVISKLLHCSLGNAMDCFLLMTRLSKMDDFLKVHQRCQQLLDFNVENPTGRYRLHLANPSDFSVAESVFLLSRWEGQVARQCGHADLSKHADWSCVRNCIHMNQHVGSIATWRLPLSGELKLDYTSWRRPQAGCVPLPNEVWTNFYGDLTHSTLSPAQKVDALWRVSDQLYLKAAQLRELLGLLPSPEQRLDLLQVFIVRLFDPQNLKMVKARLGADEYMPLKERIGCILAYGFLQPEACAFVFDLAQSDDRLMATILIQLANRERYTNIRNPRLVLPNGQEFPFERGIPQSWEKIESIHREGVLSFVYMCSPEDRKMDLRIALAKKYGAWQVDCADVTWWSALTEAPDEVLTLLDLCVRRSNDVYVLFSLFDGPSGNGEITLFQFRKQLEAWGWNKDLDAAKSEVVFRWFDPDGSGTITKDEWGVFHSIWKELNLRILEFLAFIHGAYRGDFDRAFSEMDADGGGSIDLDEWGEAVLSIGFFGPTRPIFNYAADCVCGERAITTEGWARLENMWAQKDILYERVTQTENVADSNLQT